MKEYAEIFRALENGHAVQWRDIYGAGTWQDTDAKGALHCIANGMKPNMLRVKPRTININGHEVPEPLRVAPADGVEYWIAHLGAENISPSNFWDGNRVDNTWLARGICHATKEAAELHARALLSFTKQP